MSAAELTKCFIDHLEKQKYQVQQALLTALQQFQEQPTRAQKEVIINLNQYFISGEKRQVMTFIEATCPNPAIHHVTTNKNSNTNATKENNSEESPLNPTKSTHRKQHQHQKKNKAGSHQIIITITTIITVIIIQ